jgi:beta-galactosidase
MPYINSWEWEEDRMKQERESTMKRRWAVCALVIVLLSVEIMAVDRFSSSRRIDSDWRFLKADPAGAEKTDFNDQGWRVLDVPHDWSIEGAYTPENTAQNAWLPGGVGWYRRTINVPENWLNQRVRVRFEGVYMNSCVWINGREVGGRPYGFMTFACELSEHLQAGRNVLALRVDNTPVPTSRFYHGSGIYGHVDLLVLPPVHVVPDGGVFVRTIALDGGRAELAVDTELRNDSAVTANVRVGHRVLDATGTCVAEADMAASRIPSESGGKVTCRVRFGGARRWSPEEPYLYRLETTVALDGRTVDVHHTAFGVRTVAFQPDTGFWLNGWNIKLKGVCEHQELGPMGLAVPDDLIAWRLRKLKAMGCNAIRTAHNPFTPTFYDLCDRLGMLVVDELFDGWHRKGANDYGGRFFADWWQRDVTDWVRGFYRVKPDGAIGEVTAVAILGERVFEKRTMVAIDCQSVSLCRKPMAALVAIHYTVDGSEPTATSPTYNMPIPIETTTTVRALVFIGGHEAVRSTAEFRKGKKPRISDPRWKEVADKGGPFEESCERSVTGQSNMS